MNDFDALVRSLSPVLYLNHTTGDIRTRDSYGRTVVPGGTAQWGLAKSRRGFYPGGSAGTGVLTVVDGGVTPELRLTQGTLFVAGPLGFIGDAVARRLLSKTTGTLEYDFQYTNAVLAMQATAGVSSIASTTPAKRSYIASFVNGGVATFYRDGNLLGAGAGAITSTPGTGNLSIWNMAAIARPVTTPGQVALIFNTVLTDEQISDLDEAFARIPGIGKAQKIYSASANLRPAGIDCTEMFIGQIGSDGKIAGLKGVSVGTITQPVGVKKSKCCLNPAMVGKGLSSAVTPTEYTTLTPVDAGAVEFVAKPLVSIANGYPFYGSTDTYNLVLAQAGTLRWVYIKGNPQMFLVTPNGSCRINQPAHIVITWSYDGVTRTAELFLDGVSMGTVAYTGGAAAGGARLFGNTTTLGFTGEIPFTRFYNQRITAAQARSLYVEASRAGMVQDERFGYPVSLANVTAGKVGPWNRGTGTWQWQDDGSQRKLVSIGSGYAWRDGFGDGSAFGAWCWKLKHVDGAGATYLGTIASEKLTFGGATQNGYFVGIASNESLVLYRVTGGVAVATVFATGASVVVLDVEYEMFKTRRYDGLFTLYIRGGAYLTWTAIASGTDATHIVSNFLIAVNLAGDTLSELMYIPMGGTLTPNDVPGLED